MPEKKFYVYLHKYASGPKEGQVFYVGKGCGNRHRSKKDRNSDWREVVRDFGFVSDKIMHFYSSQCAFSFEQALIRKYGIKNLVNISYGGAGANWGGSRGEYSGRGNPRYDNTIYRFRHNEIGVFEGTKRELSVKYNVDIFGIYSIVSGKRKHVSGWHIDGVKPNFQKGEDHPSYDDTEYRFYHEMYGNVTCTRYWLCKNYGISGSNLKSMIKGIYKTSKGWRLA